MDEIAQLRKSLAEEQRRRESAEALARDEQRRREAAEALAQDEQRQRQEEQHLREAAEALAQDEQRRREDSEELAREYQRDAAAAAAAYQMELDERRRVQLGQTLQDYLADIHRLNFLASRLTPPGPSSVPTLSDGRKSKSTTDGRTNIVGKYYPLQMRAWPECLDVCQAAFERIEAALGPQQCFPSALEMGFLEKQLKERIPEEFLDSESFRNEVRTSDFLHETLQMPAQRIMNAFLESDTRGPQKKLFFDNCTVGWHTQVSTTTTGDDTGDSDEEGAHGTATPSKPPVKTRPDCLVLCANVLPLPAEVDMADADNVGDVGDVGGADEGDGGDDIEQQMTGNVRRVYRITIGEHKALHRLRSAVVSRFLAGSLQEDFMVQLAKSTKTGPVAQDAAGSEQHGAADTAPRGPPDEATLGANLPDVPPGQVFFARALTQTFHYMIASGIEFGFTATGETLTLLRISRDDPTVLLYNTMLFPQYCRRQLNSQDTAGSAGGVGGADGTVRRLAVAMLCGLSLLAYESTPESPRQRRINIYKLAPFPKLPPSLADQSRPFSLARSPSRDGSRDGSRGRRRRRRDGSDDGDDERMGDDGSAGQGYLRVPNYQPRKPSPLKRQRSASNASSQNEGRDHKRQRADGPQRNGHSCMPLPPSRFDPSSFRPIRPYCTQACLRGLVDGERVDVHCPNVTLHLEARRRTDPRRTAATHAITKDELGDRLRQQLLDNAEQDCACLLDEGFRGAIGCLFRITLTGYGYTFVAKGVQTYDRRRLRHEARLYEQLAAHQGFLIPVCLGVIRLRLPYPMANCTLVTDMLLMSFAGLPLYSPKLGRLLRRTGCGGIDLEAETARTMRELATEGLQELDDESNGNFTWCAETRRVMKIDFDQARIVRRGGRDGHEVGAARPALAVPDGRRRSNELVWGGPRASAVDSLLLA